MVIFETTMGPWFHTGMQKQASSQQPSILPAEMPTVAGYVLTC